MTIAEQIKAIEATLAEKKAEQKEVMQKSADEGRSTAADEAERVDTLKAEIKSLEADLVRWRDIERSDAETAKAVEDTQSKGEVSGESVSTMQLKKQAPKLEKGIAFARRARVKGLSYMEHERPLDIAKSLYPNDESIHRFFSKAAVPAANTTDATWAGNLVSDESGAYADFVEYLRPATILGKFGANGIPSLRRVPFRTRLLSQTGGGDGYWVGEGKPKPVTSFAYGTTTIEPLKVANIAIATMELLRDSSPSADMLIRDSLRDALVERLDIDFTDPGKAAAAGVSPASILNAQTAITSAGSDAVDIRTDIKAIFAAFIAANNTPSTGVWLMPATTGLALSLLQNPLGQAEFPGVGMSGGTLFGLPVITSEYMTRTTEGAVVALVNAQDIYFADEGGIEVKASDQASLQALDNPTNASAPASGETPTTLVSMFQTNSVAFLAERTLNWKVRRAESVQYLEGVTWGDAS